MKLICASLASDPLQHGIEAAEDVLFSHVAPSTHQRFSKG